VQSELRSATMAVGGFATDTCGAGRHSPLDLLAARAVSLRPVASARSFCDHHRSQWLALYAYNDFVNA
jgi:hypothetical protein